MLALLLIIIRTAGFIYLLHWLILCVLGRKKSSPSKSLKMGVKNEVSNQLVFFVNGKKISVTNPNPEWTLVYFLRNKLGQVGTKESCGSGGCGACTVMMSRIDPTSGKIKNMAVNACLMPLSAVHGAAIVTVEGIGNVEKLHPIQERIAKSHSTQCGFCSPGFVMSTYALLRNNPKPTEMELEHAIQGNLCRCTGYRPILESLKTFCGSPNCCKNRKESSDKPSDKITDSEESNGLKEVPYSLMYDETGFKPYEPSQDPIFPPELALEQEKLNSQSLQFESDSLAVFRPSSLEELLNLRKSHPDAILIAGGTAPGLRQKINESTQLTMIQISPTISELLAIEEKADYIEVGAAVTFAQLEEFCRVRQKENSLGNIFRTYANWAVKVGDTQLRNVGTVGGALMCDNPASDFTTFLAGVGASATLKSFQCEDETILVNSGALRESGGLRVKPTQVLTSIKLPKTQVNEHLWFVKRSNRKYGDSAIVNALARIKFGQGDGGSKIHSLNFALGGKLLGKVVQSKELSHLLKEINWSSADNVSSVLASAVLENIPLKLDADITSTLTSVVEEFASDVTSWKKGESSSASNSSCTPTKSTQVFEIRTKDANDDSVDLVGRPILHLSALKNTTGEATFLDDIPPFANELFGSLVLSTKAKAKIISIDASAALAIDGVVDFVDAKSIASGQNSYGHETKDEQVFREESVISIGQVLGMVLATDPLVARKASSYVKVQYDDKDENADSSPIFTIEEAIEKKSFLAPFKLQWGDTEGAFKESEHIIEGEIRSSGQKHFYMETQGARVFPMEDGGVNLAVTSQSLTMAQELVAKTIGVSANKVIVSCQRIGGGFGGKESKPNQLAAIVAVAATKLKRPVRCVIPRFQDSQTTGGRHPFLTRYKVGFNSDGKINAISAEIYSNAGSTTDLSIFIMQTCIYALGAAYNIPSMDITGTPCLTNLQSNTAFRGFGGPQASFIIENILERVAEKLGKDTNDIRQRHLFKEGEMLGFSKFVMENCTIRRCWEEVLKNAKVQERKEAVKEFNRNSKFIKRGLAMSTCSQAMGFPVPFMNQGGALVMIYTDGSVGLNHGGIEMGQGIHTKMAQVASRVLGIPLEKITVCNTATDKVPNSFVSAGSMTADLNGPAVVAACEELNRRLAPFKEQNPNGVWEQWVGAAFFNRVNLSANGFNKLEFEHFTNYYTFGVACTEVEINCLTGEQKVLRTDIVMDVGESLNPAIDIGQIEGAFVQGLGLFTLEEPQFSETGKLVSTIPLNYKIPTVANIPSEFNVSLLRGSSNPKAVFSSKAIGEPPIYLAISIFLAIQNAIKDFRKDHNLSTEITLDAPLTCDKIRRACQIKT